MLAGTQGSGGDGCVKLTISEIYGNEKLSFEMNVAATIADVKVKMEQDFRGNPKLSDQRLIFGGIEHPDDTTLGKVFYQVCVAIVKPN